MVLGPGLVTGASDDDPSGIATYAQDGRALRVHVPVDHHRDAPDDDLHPVHLRTHRAGDRPRAGRCVPAAVPALGAVSGGAALVATAMLNGLLAPVILVLVMRVSSDRAVMGIAAIALIVVTVFPSLGGPVREGRASCHRAGSSRLRSASSSAKRSWALVASWTSEASRSSSRAARR